MPRRWKSLLSYALLSGLLLTSCEPGSPGILESPTAPSAAPSADAAAAGYTFVSASPLSALTSTVSLIGASGGALSLLGHTITVPAGAVTQPTLFSIAALPSGRIEVELRALRISLFGQSLDVGSGGFHAGKTVRLTLSYAGATNVDDRSRLVVLYMRSDGGVEELPTTVNTAARTVTVELSHFSRYCMAMD
jgi:hypothetical protein